MSERDSMETLTFFICILLRSQHLQSSCQNLLLGLKHSYCRKPCDDDNDDCIALLLRIFVLSHKILGSLAGSFLAGLWLSCNFHGRRLACYKYQLAG